MTEKGIEKDLRQKKPGARDLPLRLKQKSASSEVKLIPLTQGLCAIVKDEHFEWLNQWKWLATKNRDGNFYAIRKIRIAKKVVPISMARFLMHAPEGMLVDHKDHNTLNNDTDNLRLCTVTQNQYNRKRGKNNKSGYKGVVWLKNRKKWKAVIGVDKKYIYLGLFETAEEAGRAYDVAALKHHGEFACLNFPIKVAA